MKIPSIRWPIVVVPVILAGGFALLAAEWVGEFREKKKAELSAEKERRECAENPDYECAITLALSIAHINSLGFRHEALSEIAGAQMEAGDFDSALVTAQTIASTQHRVMILGEIAGAQVEAGKIDDALAIMLDISDEDDRAEVLSDIAVAQAKMGDFDNALDTARSINSAYTHAWTLREIAVVQEKAKNRSSARDIFSAALSVAQSVDGEHLRTGVLRDIAVARAEVGDYDAALDTVRIINSDTFASIPDDCFEHLCKIAAAPTKAEYKSLAGGACAVMLSNLRSSGGLSNHADDWLLIGIVHSVAEQVSDARAWALRDIAMAQAKAGKTSLARETFSAALSAVQCVVNRADRAEVLFSIAEGRAQIGDFNESFIIARNISDAHYRAAALRVIASAQAESGDALSAWVTFAAALSAARSVDNVNDRANALIRIAEAQAKFGDVDNALTIVQNFNAAYNRNSGLRQIALAQAESGNINSALATAGSINRTLSRAWTLRGIAGVQMDMGNIEDALATARNIDKAHPRAAHVRAGALGDIAGAQAKAGDFRGAIQTAMQIERDLTLSKTLAIIAKHMVAHGKGEV